MNVNRTNTNARQQSKRRERERQIAEIAAHMKADPFFSESVRKALCHESLNPLYQYISWSRKILKAKR